VAEGVETEAQYSFLRDQACDELQGYYFSKPCHPDAFAEHLSHRIPSRSK
jgi:EAL domain-containing protein (putative c-di-GMP-specific phosphodiesterase class I)